MAQHLGVSTAIGIEAALCAVGVAAGLLYFFSHRAEVIATEDVPVARSADERVTA